MGFIEEQAKKMLGEGISQMAGQVLGGGDLGDLRGVVEKIISMLKQNLPIDQIAKDIDKPENFVQSISEVISKAGKDADIENILESVMKLPGLKK
mgnify:CR=1 FL=1